MEELGDFEWERHKPSWGAIPEARYNHYAFVFEKKMFVVGGVLSGATSTQAKVKDISYLDLSTCLNLCFSFTRAICLQFSARGRLERHFRPCLPCTTVNSNVTHANWY